MKAPMVYPVPIDAEYNWKLRCGNDITPFSTAVDTQQEYGTLKQ